MPVAIEGEYSPTEVGYDIKLQSGQDPGKDDEHADELLCLCRNPLVVQTHSFISCPGGWSQTIPQMKNPAAVVTRDLRLDILPNSLK